MTPKLIPNWRRAWRMASVQAMSAALAILSAWGAMPEDLKARIPEDVVLGLAIALLVLGIVGRLVDQPSTRLPDHHPHDEGPLP